MKVYLAGPITGLTYANAEDWRRHATAVLGNHGITAFSPLRYKENLAHLAEISGHGKEYAHLSAFATPKAVLARDHFDATRCDVLFVNLLGAQRVSIGTMFEMAWANAKRTPIVLAMEPEGNVHEHMFVTETAGFRAGTLGDALEIVRGILV